MEFRVCTLEDLDQIMELQEKICQGMGEHPDWFADTSREDNAWFLEEPNLLLGVFDGDRLAAYGSIGFEEDAPGSMGWEFGWDEETVRRCALLDTIVVDEDYRGQGLQRELICRCVEHAAGVKSGCIVLTTIAPDNIYSLRNAQAEGFEVQKRVKKYGGKDRYILSLHCDCNPESVLQP